MKKSKKEAKTMTTKKKPPTIDERIEWEKRLVACQTRANDLRKKYKELLKRSGAAEEIVEYAKTAIQGLPRVPAPKRRPKKQGVTKESVVVVGSCWHIGEVINKQEMGGLNEYNFEIFIRRYQWLIEKVISFCKDNMRTHDFEELHLLLTGDMVSGIIHEELTETNDLHIVDQALMGALITAQGLLDLAREFPSVIVTCVAGNHGRTTQKKQSKGKQTKSWDYVFYNLLASLLQKQKNIHFNIPKSYWAMVEIQGHVFQVQHGDTIKSWGGIPFYGLNREMGKWVEIHASHGKYVRYYVTSHFHTKAILQSGVGERIMNGSLKGGDEYAIGLALFGDPVQIMFGVHQEYGKTWEVSLNAKHAKVAEIRYKCDLTLPLSDQLDPFEGA